MENTYQNYVNGEWVTSETGETFAVRNPAHTNEVIAEFQASSRADAIRAIEAATEAQDEWKDTPGPTRGAILTETAKLLEARKDELVDLLTAEEGKTHAEAAPEVQRAIDIFSYYAQRTRDFMGTVKASSSGDSNLYTIQEPLGTVGLITPWNYPIAIPAWKIAPALAAGNTVVFKPASTTPGVAREIVACLDRAGLPDGVLNFITGSGQKVGDPFTTHPDVDGVSFTGSSAVGNMVYDAATADQKRIQTEMGGKNPTIVMPSADLDSAVDIVSAGAFGVTGQACTACSRAIVHTSIYNDFIEAVIDSAEGIKIGGGADGADMGPHITQNELESTLEYIDIGQNEGATLAAGGGRPAGSAYEDGFYIEPTVFVDVDTDMRIAQEEIFGPVLSVIEVDGFEEALDVANDVEYGLSASIVTQDITEANRFIDKIESGVAKVNEKTTGLELHVPFGGVGNSSSETYREQGDAALEFYTISKTVYESY